MSRGPKAELWPGFDYYEQTLSPPSLSAIFDCAAARVAAYARLAGRARRSRTWRGFVLPPPREAAGAAHPTPGHTDGAAGSVRSLSVPARPRAGESNKASEMKRPVQEQPIGTIPYHWSP